MNSKQYQSAVYFIGSVLVICVVGIIAITLMTDDSIPDVLQNIAVGSLTGLVGLLVTPRDGTAQPVRVVNAANDAVPVEERGQVGFNVFALVALIVVLAAFTTLAVNTLVFDLTIP